MINFNTNKTGSVLARVPAEPTEPGPILDLVYDDFMLEQKDWAPIVDVSYGYEKPHYPEMDVRLKIELQVIWSEIFKKKFSKRPDIFELSLDKAKLYLNDSKYVIAEADVDFCIHFQGMNLNQEEQTLNLCRLDFELSQNRLDILNNLRKGRDLKISIKATGKLKRKYTEDGKAIELPAESEQIMLSLPKEQWETKLVTLNSVKKVFSDFF